MDGCEWKSSCVDKVDYSGKSSNNNGSGAIAAAVVVPIVVIVLLVLGFIFRKKYKEQHQTGTKHDTEESTQGISLSKFSSTELGVSKMTTNSECIDVSGMKLVELSEMGIEFVEETLPLSFGDFLLEV